MKKLLILFLFSSSVYSSEYLFKCSAYDSSTSGFAVLKINTQEQFMEMTSSLSVRKTIPYNDIFKIEGRIIVAGEGESKMVENSYGKQKEVFRYGSLRFDKLLGILEHQSFGYNGRIYTYVCKPHKQYIQ